ncbi:hypothetical protein DPMN_015821 [Dreissena polymorpha]|uniref:Uncharacterized protein n=1 Tax=Dreissena polymorpha TaxID=45954 RepID=A0A9D4NC62_DREPO|nr:hypothetical protein DPMN_015821 [Dreissena polymorpha]
MGILGILPVSEMELHPVPYTGFPPSLPEHLSQTPVLHAERQPSSGETALMSEPLRRRRNFDFSKLNARC